MNVQEYISSGAIEACVMGLADEKDWLELEEMAARYPEVREIKEQIEREQEQQHLAAAVRPPGIFKERIAQALSLKGEERKGETPIVPMTEEPTKTRPLFVPVMPTPKSVRWLQGAVAASVILLMGSVILNFYFYSKSATYRKEYNDLVVQQNSLLARNQAMEASFNIMKNANVKQVVMEPTPGNAGSLATVYWDTRSKDVYLMVNNLPEHPSDKQYQLWAIVDGKPVDAGMLDAASPDNMLLKMHNIPEAQAFAITLEKKGGSPTPTMDAMYVMGKV